MARKEKIMKIYNFITRVDAVVVAIYAWREHGSVPSMLPYELAASFEARRIVNEKFSRLYEEEKKNGGENPVGVHDPSISITAGEHSDRQ